MEPLTFRIDDVSANTNMASLAKMCEFLKTEFDANIILGVTLFAKRCDDGSVYPNPPFKDKPNSFFYFVDKLLSTQPEICQHCTQLGLIASHGLLHVDHSKMSLETQELSILTSCNYLNTRIFIPPFNKWDENTKIICDRNDIRLITMHEGWKSLEYNDFNPDHKFWYFHPWKYTFEDLKKCLLRLGTVTKTH